MNRRSLLAVSLVLVAGCASAPPRIVPVPTLAGEWEPVAAELGGKDFSLGGPGTVLRLTTDTYEIGSDRGTYALPPGGTPAPIDVRGVDGPNAGRTIAAIYEFAGDKLTICYQLGNGARPATFASPPDSRVLLVRYQRVP